MTIPLYPRRWGGTSEAPHCWYCDDRVATIKNCADCMTAIYCDKICQTSDWKGEDGHKLKCRAIVERKKIQEEHRKIDPALVDDHQKVEALMSKIRSTQTPEQRRTIARKIMLELESYNSISEEELLYPIPRRS